MKLMSSPATAGDYPTHRICRLPLLAAVTLLLLALSMLCCCSSPSGSTQNPDGVVFSLEPGSYEQASIALELSCKQDGDIHYTLDGSTPTEDSALYEEPIELKDRTSEESIIFSPEACEAITVSRFAAYDDPGFPKANVVRAVCIGQDGSQTPVATGTYFVGQDLQALYGDRPVISIVTDPDNLIGYDNGILVKGRVFDEWMDSDDEAETILADPGRTEYVQGNFSQKGKEWERPASFEIIADNTRTYAFNGGVRIKGGSSRIFSQMSMNVYLRDDYGQEEMDYPLIATATDDKGAVVDRYTHFVLRNGGNDTEYVKFKDAFLQSLVDDRAVGTQASVTAIAFYNGEYAGPYNLQERFDDTYFANHYGVDPDNVVVIKEGEVEEGEDEDIELYEQLRDYADKDLGDPAVWEQFKTEMDVESMADYFATEIYIGNLDWWDDHNTMLWRTRTSSEGNSYADGKWRWCLYDTEFSSAMYSNQPNTFCDFNSFSYAVEKHPLFAAALENEEFRTLFLESLKEIGGTNYAPERVEERLNEYVQDWQPLMADYYKRFGDTSRLWDHTLDNIKDYFQNRYDYIIGYAETGLQQYE